jgi:hypothetical protein
LKAKLLFSLAEKIGCTMSTYVYDFQHGILIFFKTNTLIIHAVLYGRRMCLSSEVKSADLVGIKTGRSEKYFNLREGSLNIGEKNDCNAEYQYF